MLSVAGLMFIAMVGLSAASVWGDPMDLREAMGDETFVASGLDRLTPEELAVLSAWIAERSAEGSKKKQDHQELPRGEGSFGFEQVTDAVAAFFERESPEAIESRILGNFEGWNGSTVFRLENGQVWKQSGPGRFFMRIENPTVIIRRGALGSYLLSVDGHRSSVRVRRIR